MAAPMQSPWKVRYVVPWKTRCDFVTVFHDLYCDDRGRQIQALERIAAWKSRVGNKLSVAIESSAALVEACKDHKDAIHGENLAAKDWSLRCSYSLALIRFVNHITEKGQTKAAAQPVHLIAKEFGIPDWIVRLRHDSTHSTLPCLETLATAATWCLQYLRKQFWECQLQDSAVEKGISSDEAKKPPPPTMRQIRRAISSFQRSHFVELKSSLGEKTELKKERMRDFKRLSRYLQRCRPRFIRCLLEDGALIATSEQLVAFGLKTEEILCQPTPQIPGILSEFWKPVIHELQSQGVLALMVQAALNSITNGEGLRNHLLAAWVACILSHSADYRKRKSKYFMRKKSDADLFRKALTLPRKELFTACTQNMNQLTSHLLKYLALEEDIGTEAFKKLSKLLNLTGGDEQCTIQEDMSDSESSDLDHIYTVEDLKQAKVARLDSEIPETMINDIQTSMNDDKCIWNLCTDIVQWSKVPLGCVPDNLIDGEDTEMTNLDDKEEDSQDDDDDDDGDKDNLRDKDNKAENNFGTQDYHSSSSEDFEETPCSRKRLRRPRGDSHSEDRNGPSPKQSKYVVKGDGLL